MQLCRVAGRLGIAIHLLWVCAVQADDALTFSDGPTRTHIRMTADPAIGDWTASPNDSPHEHTWQSSGGYRAEFTRTLSGKHATWKLQFTRTDAAPFRIHEYAWQTRIPLANVVSIFDTQVPEGPSLFRQAPQIDVALEIRPNAGIPFLMACDHYGRNRLAFGPADQTGTYRLSGRRDAEEYVVSAVRTEYEADRWFSSTELTDRFFISTEPAFWFDAARSYADFVDASSGYHPRPIPAAAQQPWYSTWYAFGEDINEQIVWDNAKIASRLGIGNFVIFIGWSTCRDWFSSENAWGDYVPCGPRFADLPSLVRRMQQEFGLAVHVWTAPTWIGAGSQSFEKMKDHRSKWPAGGYDRNLDPRSPAARDHIRDRFAAMARTLGADGYYVDFLDTVYNRNDAEHAKEPLLFGAGLDLFLQACYEGFAAEHAAPAAQVRRPFANLLSKHHASIFTTTYTDHRWDRNRMLAVSHRPFSKGVAYTCDPLVWTREEFEDRDFVGKTLSAVMMCGAPGISIDLTQLPEDRLGQLQRWFAFYAMHRETINNGEFRPFGEEYQYPEMMVAREGTALAWVSRLETGRIPFPEGTRHAVIFTNLPRDESFIARVDLTAIGGLVPGKYQARRFNSSLESHDEPMTIEVRPTPAAPADSKDNTLKTARENWDWTPDESRPSLDIARGGFWEFTRLEP